MKSSRNQQKLLSQLRSLLESRAPDYGQILKVSSKLASFDPENVRFTADSGLISRLGKELVARQETAVSELVKNAFDADALRVRLVFANAEKPGGELVISDDGLGMTRQQLVNGFMRLASTEKVDEPISPRYGRQRAGRKGIGRFAAQRLGERLQLTTQTESTRTALSVDIDWRDFERGNDLFEISSQLVDLPKERDEGTTLRIVGLREAWTDAQVARVYRYVSELIQPYPLARRRRPLTGREADPGFKALFYRSVDGEDLEIASEERMIFDYALAEVTAKVNSTGRGSWRVMSRRFNLDHKSTISADSDNPKLPFECLRNVHLKAYYFNWAPDLVPGQQLSRLRNLAQEQGGIRLYRNGFRVLPYGERKNDWLGLDEEYRKRTVLPPIANPNWFGFVEVSDPDGDKFEETSSREGVENNSAYQELVAFARSALIAAAQRVASVRERKQTASQKGFRSKLAKSPSELLEQVANELEEAANELEQSPRPTLANGLSSPSAAVRDAAQHVRAVGQEIIHENAMLRVLAGLGLTIGMFTHEVLTQLLHLRSLIEDWLNIYGHNSAVKKILPLLESKLELLRSYAGYFDEAISANVRRDLEEQDVTKTLFDFVEQFERAAERNGTKFVERAEIDEDLMTLPMHPSEWASILGNLLTNSLKAIRRSSNRGRGRILIRARREQKTVLIDFADNGDGIPRSNEDQIFNPFFTTTHLASSTHDELTGTGLGLTIVRDILSAYGGDIYLTMPPDGFKTCFRIEIPAAEQAT